MRGRVALQAAADLETVHAGHHHVEKHDIAVALPADDERLGATGGGDDIEIFGSEAGFEKLQVGGEIVDDENAGRHETNS